MSRVAFNFMILSLLPTATAYFSVFGGAGFEPATARAAGLAHSENFVVVAADPPLANAVLTAAEEYRRQAAVLWLGRELPPSIGRTTISVETLEGDSARGTSDSGLTWAIDSPQRTMHKMWITAPRGALTGGVLAHECVHVVLETRYPQQLPCWFAEGAASQVDDALRQRVRRDILAYYVESGQWPRLEALFSADSIIASDRARYATAASLVEYLISLGDRPRLVQFAVEGKRSGWDLACRNVYHIDSVDALQQRWQAFVAAAIEPR